jgi:alkylation response protein AidB-like acyl-CoA dehydrogenase
MNAPLAPESLTTDADRTLLRDSLRALLAEHWPAERAPELAADPTAVAMVTRKLGEQGLLALGGVDGFGGLREVLLAMEELGRAGCPAPLAAAVLANLALARGASPAADALLDAVQAGEARLCFALGAADGDVNAGAAVLRNGLLSGTIAFAEGAAGATHIVVAAGLDADASHAETAALALVDISAAGLTVTATPGLSVPPLSQLRFDETPAVTLHAQPGSLDTLNLVSRLCLLARALGAANRGFELVLEHARQRTQFGQPIGRFQAVQHKLADCLIGLDGARLTMDNAASSRDSGGADWTYFASAALAYAGPVLRQVSLETQHVFGAIGYAEEHEAPRHFRRTHADLVRQGGVGRARAELAQWLLNDAKPVPEYDLGKAGNAFRQEARAWIQANWTNKRKPVQDALPPELRGYDPEYARGLGEQGWNTLSWPKEYGGQARTPFEQLAFIEESQLAGAPNSRGGIQAHALMAYGTQQQKDEFLPRIARGEITFCLGYSEPEAGSDLVALKTSAVREGDEWVINGQKLWTTGAEYADYMWLAARTDPDAKPKHAGISMFIVPMNTPGITVRPSMAMYGHTFCTEFLDNVRVPASALVGEVNQGWAILTSALATERIVMGGFVAAARAAFELVVAELRAANRLDAVTAARIGELAAEIEVARQLLTRSVAMAENGQTATWEAAMSKTFSGELMQRLGEAALDLLGTGATLSQGAPGAITDGRLEHMLRHSIMIVVGGGTNEIQRTLIAQRGLNLPR